MRVGEAFAARETPSARDAKTHQAYHDEDQFRCGKFDAIIAWQQNETYLAENGDP
jgi:hypothetical protein